MNNLSNRLIIIAGIILVILIATTIFISSLFRGQQSSQQPTLIPTGTFESGGFRGGTSPTLTQQQLDKLINDTKNVPILSADQSDRVLNAGDKLPFTSGDLDLGYSPTLAKFFIQKKTPQADAALQKFIQDNNLQDVFQNFPGMFVFTTQSVDQAIQQAEQQFSQQKQEFQNQQQQQLSQTPAPSQNPSNPQSEQTDQQQQLFFDFMKTLLTFNLGPTLTPTPPEGTGGGGGGGGGNIPANMLPYSSTPKALFDIFVEAGGNVGAPPILLEAIMNNECGAIISFSSSKISAYAAPAKGIVPGDPDSCFQNPAGCKGPMQFSDGTGPRCNANTWQVYAHAVKTFGGYNYTPYIENIRDSVYAAALYMKSLAHPANKFNWTKSEIFNALQHYSGGGCPSYCDKVWAYISNRH